MTDGPSNDELGRRMDGLSSDIRAGFETINLRLDKYVLAEVHGLIVGQLERRLNETSKRVDTLEDDRKSRVRWGVTTVVAVLALCASIALGVIAIFVK